ncbi:MAG: NlpC/P60 family protein [Mycobacterium sp.]|nr:NlpC/P60 family protein [Mycobacterium sp.]
MARRRTWIALAIAIPATVAFTPVHPPGSPPSEPPPVPPAQPVVAMTPVPAAPAALPGLPTGLPKAPGSLPAPGHDVGTIVANAALSRLGAPYAWAAAGPDAFDCSGLVVWSFRQAGVTLPRSSQALASGGQPVPLDQMRPGDVISLFPDASHVGIYVGNGRMVHAQFEGQPVVVESLFRAPIHNVRRYQ